MRRCTPRPNPPARRGFEGAIAVLRDDINTALKEAMKSRDERRVATLRLVNAAIKNADIEAQMQGKALPSDSELQALLQKLIKQRQESAEIYTGAGRKELADRERDEIEIIRVYLPQQVSGTELDGIISATMSEVDARSMRDMGKVMAALRQNFAGRIDFGEASQMVKAKLSG
jgi:uncharacterized protein YqeY